MPIQFSVQRFDEEIEAAYLRLFPGEAESKPAELLRWRFRDGPHGPGYFALARDSDAGDAIVGMIGLIATRLRAVSADVRALQAVDTIVDPAYRGKGLFVGMGRAAQEQTQVHGAALIWGFPNANAAPGWFGKLGWKRFGSVPFMFRPLRSSYVLGRIAAPLKRIDLSLVWRRGSVQPRPVRRFGAEAEGLIQAWSSAIGCGVDRGTDMLNWRLFDKPDAYYRVQGCFADDGSMTAMVAHCVLDKHGGRVLYIMEALALPGHERQLAALLRRVAFVAARDGAEIGLAWCPAAAPNRKAYRRAGFMTLPDKLRPVQIYFGARDLQGELPPATSDAASWYLSYLDSDTV